MLENTSQLRAQQSLKDLIQGLSAQHKESRLLLNKIYTEKTNSRKGDNPVHSEIHLTHTHTHTHQAFNAATITDIKKPPGKSYIGIHLMQQVFTRN